MSFEPLLADQAAAADQPSADQVGEEDALYFRRVLRSLVEFGHALTEMVVEEAGADTQNTRPATVAYERVTGSMRRSMMLHEKLGRAKKPLSVSRIAARKRIIRDVEDAIQCEGRTEDQETLHAELLERLDRPELDSEIAERPIGEIVTDICRDLGVAAFDAAHPWKRRIPHDIAILNARAELASGAPLSEKLAALLASAPPRPPGSDPPEDADEPADMKTLLQRLRQSRQR